MIRQNNFSRRQLARYSRYATAAALVSQAVGEAGEAQVAGSILDVGDIRVGHFTDARRPTGCTVILFDKGAVAGVDVRGSAPGTRETDLLSPVNVVAQVNAIVLSGGSAFGLDSATGVMKYLDEKGKGYRVGSIVVPIVPAAILFDLNVGDPKIRPDANSGYAACVAASATHVPEGNVGAGAGATVGKLFGFHGAMKSGLGTASVRIGASDLVVGAIVAVNAVGDVKDRRSGKILAGALAEDGKSFRDSMAHVSAGELLAEHHQHVNTTIGVIATNANLTKTEMTKVAQMAHDGFARCIYPTHTAADGDTIFAAATGSSKVKADTITIGSVAAEAMADAVQRAVVMATSIPGYPARRDLPANLRTL